MNATNGEPSPASAGAERLRVAPAAAQSRHPVDVMRDLERAEADLASCEAALGRATEAMARAQAHRAALALEIRPVLEREGPLLCNGVVRWIDADGQHHRLKVHEACFVPRTPPDHDDLSESAATAAEIAELRSC